MKKLFYYTVIFISIFSFSSCDEETLDALLGTSTRTKLYFRLSESTDRSFVTVRALGESKNASVVASTINPCGGGNFVGFAEFSFAKSLGSISYTVFDIEGASIGSGNISLDSDCIKITLE